MSYELPTITAEITDAPTAEELEDFGGQCSASYEVTVQIGEHELTARGWILCGWLAPGAHANLDGSGLALWGDSQPGGWECLGHDSQFNGALYVDDGPADYDEPIIIGGAEGGVDAEVTSGMVPIWEAALRTVDAAHDREDDEEIEAAEAIASEIREALVEALVDALPEAPNIEAPEAEQVWDDLRESDESPVIRYGDWNGAGYVMAWKTADDDYDYTYWPDEGDVARAVEATSDLLAEDIWSSIARDLSRDDD